MRRKLRILFTEQPEDLRYIQGTHTKVTMGDAIQFIIDGLACPYDETIQILGEDCPERDILFANRIYTVKNLEDEIAEIEKYDGIGPVTARKLQEFLNADQEKYSFQPDER